MGVSMTNDCWTDVRRVIAGAQNERGCEELVTTVLEPLFARGLDVDVTPFGHTMLHVAAAQGNLTVVQAAAAHGANATG